MATALFSPFSRFLILLMCGFRWVLQKVQNALKNVLHSEGVAGREDADADLPHSHRLEQILDTENHLTAV